MSHLKEHDVFILCGGFGKRLRPVIGEKQKTMAEIDGRPFLDFLLGELARQGFFRIILGTGYRSAEVEDYFRKNSQGLDILFSKEEEPLGTGGAVKHCAPMVRSNPFFVLNGDSFCDVDYRTLLEFHQSRSATATLVLSRMQDRKDYGTIRIDAEGRICSFDEKSGEAGGGLVNAGVYCFDRKVFSLMPPTKRFSIETDFFPFLVKHAFFGHEVEKVFYDIGTPERFDGARILGKEFKE